MKIALALAVVFVGVASTAHAQSAADKGKDVFTAQKCAVCHSIGAVGNKKGPLDHVGTQLSASDIRQWITDAPAMATKTKADRKPAMKAYTLSKDDIDNLVAYLQTLK